jgi:protein SCO1/2
MHFRLVLLFALSILLGACERKDPEKWALADVEGHLPDLKFNLGSGDDHVVTEKKFEGKIVLLFFGYAHCPDICPMTMARLSSVIEKMGAGARDVRILFVSVDSFRDTPTVMADYASAFGPQVTGLAGDSQQIQDIARRYRVAYQLQPRQPNGYYEVMHSKAVYIFDRQGHARLMATDTDKPESFIHDLRQLANVSPEKSLL